MCPSKTYLSKECQPLIILYWLKLDILANNVLNQCHMFSYNGKHSNVDRVISMIKYVVTKTACACSLSIFTW